MAEPRIQYCTAPDGVNLAFCTEGQGTPIVYLSPVASFSHLQIDAINPVTRGVLEYLRPRMKVIRYDRRGQGLSDRDVTDESLEANVGDLLTLIDRLALERVALFGRLVSGPLAIAFAHRYPERVSHLILAGTTARTSEYYATPRLRALAAVMEIDWDLYADVASMMMVGWSEPDVARRMSAHLRAANTPERVRRARDVMGTWDATALLPGIRVPTLVIHVPGSNDQWSRDLAAGIPGAQLRLPDPDALADTPGGAVYEFVSGEKPATEPGAAPLPEGTVIILFADIVDSTALTEQLGDTVFRARASRLDGAMRTGIRECGGTPVEGKVMGDGVMAVFNSARQAIDAAFHCRAVADGTGLALHLGIHAGDVTREGDNVYGGAVNIASRICSLSANDEILVSTTVRDLARTSAAAAFDDRGEHQLKGIAEPVRVFAVRAGGA